ncbi:hypothetical protein LSH36_442g03006 [Paralvinella palmiformis]|uniref:Inositol-1-monophosphatase n=1 Tax=Paralvinella palmiformis TaxID=53620 RepID=A0AAD9JAU1_9ANNE|nr:hypothetical protein LSH36_442g03006 [Paralvinella palmiformis]
MANLDLNECFRVADQVAREAGTVIRDAFQEEKRIEIKESIADLVTETDKKVEQMIISKFKSHFPDHSFIGEESTAAGVKVNLTDNPTWVIDPIDGTNNFVHRFPYVAVSIALLVNKKTEIGVIYNPILDQMYTARPGEGAYCNGKRLQCTKTSDISQAMLCSEFGSSRVPEKLDSKFRSMRNVINKAHGMRCIGSAALHMCMVAEGTLDAHFTYGIHIWDMAAGYLVVEEAGGIVIDTGVFPDIFAAFWLWSLLAICMVWFSCIHGIHLTICHQVWLRSLGSAAMSMAVVASGNIDGYYESGIHCWDIAAGLLIVVEAGGVVVDTSGGPLDLMSRRVLCAGTEQLVKQVAANLEQLEFERD